MGQKVLIGVPKLAHTLASILIILALFAELGRPLQPALPVPVHDALVDAGRAVAGARGRGLLGVHQGANLGRYHFRSLRHLACIFLGCSRHRFGRRLGLRFLSSLSLEAF